GTPLHRHNGQTARRGDPVESQGQAHRGPVLRGLGGTGPDLRRTDGAVSEGAVGAQGTKKSRARSPVSQPSLAGLWRENSGRGDPEARGRIQSLAAVGS